MAANETLFEVSGTVASRFLDAVRRTVNEEDGVDIQPVDGKPRDEARRHRQDNARPVHAPKPYRGARPDHARPDNRNGRRPGPARGAGRTHPGKAR